MDVEGDQEDAADLTDLAVTDPEALAVRVGRRAAAAGGLALVGLLGADGALLRIAAVTAAGGAAAADLARAGLADLAGDVDLAGLAGVPLDPDTCPPLRTALRDGVPAAGPADPAAVLPAPRPRRTPADPRRPGPGRLLATRVTLRDRPVGVLAVLVPGRAGPAGPAGDAAALDRLGQVAAATATALQIARDGLARARSEQRAAALEAWWQAVGGPDVPATAAVRDLLERTAALLGGRCWLVTASGDVVTAGRRLPAQHAPTVWLPLLSRQGARGGRPEHRELGRLAASRQVALDAEERRFLHTVATQVALAWDAQESAHERDAAVAALRLSEQRFRLAFDAAPEGIALVELQGPDAGRVAESNQALQDLCGLGPDQLRALRYDDLVHPDQPDRGAARLAELAGGERVGEEREVRLARPDGGRVWVQVRLAVVQRAGRPWWAVVHVRDVSARRLAQEQLEHQALHDPLTGLGNRNRLLDHLRLALDRLERAPGVVAVLFVDLDHFKAVNDTRGHGAGDVVLRATAGRISAVVRSPDTVARIAADEFAVAVTVGSAADARQLADRVQAAVDPPVPLDDGDEVSLTASLGLAIARTPDVEPEDLVRRADLAMYHAKHEPPQDAGPHGVRRWREYHPGLGERARHRDEVLRMLHAALGGGRLRLLFQPIVDLASGRVVAAEALLRLAHPQRGLLTPAEFIDVAESDDVILPIGQWVLTEALRPLRTWHRRHGVQVGVNVSARQVAHRVVEAQVRAAARAAGYTGRDSLDGLRLEVTERVALQADDAVVADLRRLSELGVRLALDDFGTGYASLLHVRRLPVDELKIDGSFVHGLGIDPDDTAIVRAVTALAGSLGLDTVAEGVERPEQVPLLRELGCRHAQGYLLGLPMEEAELTRRLEAGTGALPR